MLNSKLQSTAYLSWNFKLMLTRWHEQAFWKRRARFKHQFDCHLSLYLRHIMFKVSVFNKKTKASFEFLDNLRKWRRTWDSIHGPLINYRFNRRFMTGSWPKYGLESIHCSLKAWRLNSGSFRRLKDHKRIYNLKRTFLTLTSRIGRVQSFKRKENSEFEKINRNDF